MSVTGVMRPATRILFQDGQGFGYNARSGTHPLIPAGTRIGGNPAPSIRVEIQLLNYESTRTTTGVEDTADLGEKTKTSLARLGGRGHLQDGTSSDGGTTERKLHL